MKTEALVVGPKSVRNTLQAKLKEAAEVYLINEKDSMKVLVNTPFLNLRGGVANHYKGLADYWKEKVYYNQIGKRSENSKSGLILFPFDIIIYIVKIIFLKPDIILLNPSLGKTAIIRDMVFLRMAKLLGKKVCVFFHGFNKEIQNDINLVSLCKQLNRCECIIVLANEFKTILREWGVVVPIELTTTKVDDKLIENFDVKKRNGNVKELLFLARIEKNKGIYTTLEAFRELLKHYPNLILNIVGDGNEWLAAQDYVKQNKIHNVHFWGNLAGQKLADMYINSDIYILPTHYEGMPTTVLEAMTFGMPIVTRPVGGICDFFENYKMGILVESLNAHDYASAIEYYIDNEIQVQDTSQYNYQYARKHFMASQVAKKMEDILRKYV